MDDSLSTWLALRESADWASRSASLVARVERRLPVDRPLSALDLCTGTGSNFRYLMERLPNPQEWVAVDRDEGLLAELPERVAAWAQSRSHTASFASPCLRVRGDGFTCDVESRKMDLAELDAELFAGRDLVTASALLDLVSVRWLQRLADLCRAANAAVLFAMTYDGRSSCDPVEPEDDLIRELFNRHQRTDKGLGGVAAGPEAWRIAVQAFRNVGYHTEHEPADWIISPGEHSFQRQLIDGWASASAEIAPRDAPTIADWHRRRRAHVEAGRSRIVVHHYDLAGWLPGADR